MEGMEFDRQIEAIVKQLTEQFNLAISVAVDEDKSFEQGETIFREAVAVLEYYSCLDSAVEQLVNFSKVAFFRKKYDKALFYAIEAVNKKESGCGDATDNLHAMAYKLFELVLVESSETMCGLTFDDLQEILVPEDYCEALKNIYNASKQAHTEEDKLLLAQVLKKVTLEVMRQGLRKKKQGETDKALLLLKTVQPFLNPKRAEVIAAEIEKLEGTGSE